MYSKGISRRVEYLTPTSGTITSVLRFLAFLRYAGPSADPDPTWSSVQLVIYSISEVTVYIIASCLPTYRSLYLSIRRQQPAPKAELHSPWKRCDVWHLSPCVGSRFKREKKTEVVEDGLKFYPNE